MFCHVNIAPLSCVKSIASLLSAAEMLENDLPDISGSFITYAFMLCEDYFSKNPTNPIIDESFSELKDLSTISTISSAKELEQFGDSILAAADDSSLPNEMYRLAYLAYASTSIHGSTSQRVNQKMKRIESKFLQQENNSFPNPAVVNQQPQLKKFSANPSHANNNFSLNNIPQQPIYYENQYFTQPKQASEHSVLTMPSYPSIGASSFDPPKSQAPNTRYNQQPLQNPKYTDVTHSQSTSNKNDKSETQRKCKELVEIAKVAFRNGSIAVAYAAMSAAIKELEK